VKPIALSGEKQVEARRCVPLPRIRSAPLRSHRDRKTSDA
jgi:hypothetical protein